MVRGLAVCLLAFLFGCNTSDAVVGPQATVVINPTVLEFGSVAAGASSTKTVDISNRGSLPLAITSVGLDGDGGSPFHLGPLPQQVAAGAVATMQITFSPTGAPGAVAATLTIASNAFNAPSIAIPLSATVVAGCLPETDAQLCARLQKQCGPVTTDDNCGVSRTVASCGSCVPPEVCSGSSGPTTCADPSVGVTVVLAGSGSGTVTSAPAGIDCGSVCSASFPAGTAVMLTAVPASTSRFAGFSGDCSGQVCELDGLSSARNVIATFAAAPSQLAFVRQPVNAVAGGTLAPVSVAIEDSEGNTLTDSTAMISLATSPSTSLGGTTTAAAVNGVATFSDLSLAASGSYVLTATSGALAANSAAFDVSAGSAISQVSFTTQPTSAPAATTIAPAVVVKLSDAAGNVANTNATTSLTATPSVAISGTTSVAAVNGVATFANLSIASAGSFTLTASAGSASATSDTFVISPGQATQLAFATQPSNAASASTMSPAVTVKLVDPQGNLTTSNAMVTLATSPSTALSGTTPVAAVNGVATFPNLSIAAAGAYTLTATSGALSTSSSSFVISAAAAVAHVVFGTQPSNATSGAAIAPAITVKLVDAAGNVTTSSATVTLATVPPVALAGTSSIAAVNGVATFNNLSIATAGTYTLSASSGALSVASGSFVISAGGATQLAFGAQPSSAGSGATLPAVTVKLEDTAGNTTTGAASVSLVIHPTVALSGTTSVGAVNGIATFSGLSVATAGTYTLTASSGNLSIGSASFTISPGNATSLAFGVQPSSTTSGSTLSPAITVKLLDTAGNVSTSTAAVSLATNPSTTLSGTTSLAAVNGVATFSALSIGLAGNYTLTATSGSLTTTSASFTISAGSTVGRLVFTAQPGNAVSAAPLATVTVKLEDAAGNATTSSASVSLALSPVATLSGPTSVAATSGVATFSNLSVAAAGTYSLTATVGSVTTSSNSFVISPGQVSKLVFGTQPTNAAAGATIAPAVTVKLEDAAGNVTTSNATVALTTTPSTALAGTASRAASAGVASFNDLSIAAPGSYTLGASSGSFTTTSGTFSIATASSQWVMGYYVGYSINSYPIAQIDWTGLTHIIFSPITVSVNNQGVWSLNNTYDDQNGTGPADATALALAAHAHGVKAMFMLGGSGNGTNISVAAAPAQLSAFVTALLAEMDARGMDGIDLDWEDNIQLDELVALGQALRAARPGMIITYPGGTINGNYQTVDSHFVTLAQSLDRFNVQSYYPDTAFSGSGWYSWFTSPLSGVTGNTPIAIDDTLSRYHTAGIPKAKLGMGMAFYAICYTGGITGPRQSTDGSTQQIVGGDNAYPLSAFFAANSTFDKSLSGQRLRDSVASEPYLSFTTAVSDSKCGASTQYISYDDETSIAAKGTFSKSNGYGGIIIWTIEEGWLPANASGGRAQNSLMQALKTGFLSP